MYVRMSCVDLLSDCRASTLLFLVPFRHKTPNTMKTCAFLAATMGAATASPWAGQSLANPAFVGTPVRRAAPSGLSTRWFGTAARIGAVSRSALSRLDALSMKLGEDEKVGIALAVRLRWRKGSVTQKYFWCEYRFFMFGFFLHLNRVFVALWFALRK